MGLGNWLDGGDFMESRRDREEREKMEYVNRHGGGSDQGKKWAEVAYNFKKTKETFDRMNWFGRK